MGQPMSKAHITKTVIAGKRLFDRAASIFIQLS
jgi:hypothetical protein